MILILLATKQLLHVLYLGLQLDCNVLLVDWTESSSLGNYIQAAGDTALVGREASLFLQRLETYHGGNISDVHVIGLSLGAHAAGFLGRHYKGTTGKLVSRMSGKILCFDPF